MPPRVAFQLLEQSGFADDEIMAEYLAGLLAASRTPDGRDDRAVVWSALVAGMSGSQIKAHFLLYRAWSTALAGRDLNLWLHGDRRRVRLFVNAIELAVSLDPSVTNTGPTLAHVLPGLQRLDLIGDDAAWGERDYINYKGSPFDFAVAVTPTPVGMELFGWAAGHSGIGPAEFVDFRPEWSDDLPQLRAIAVPGLEEPEEPDHKPPATTADD